MTDAGGDHSLYPYLASKEIDPELGDPIMHLSGHIVRAPNTTGFKET
jgi:hypothetical protein